MDWCQGLDCILNNMTGLNMEVEVKNLLQDACTNAVIGHSNLDEFKYLKGPLGQKLHHLAAKAQFGKGSCSMLLSNTLTTSHIHEKNATQIIFSPTCITCIHEYTYMVIFLQCKYTFYFLFSQVEFMAKKSMQSSDTRLVYKGGQWIWQSLITTP